MTQQQAQIRNHTIYRLRGQLGLFKNIPTDLFGFNEDNKNTLKSLINKLEESIRVTSFINRKYIYYCNEHIPENPQGLLKTTRNNKACCSLCGATHHSSPLFYIKKELHASTDQS